MKKTTCLRAIQQRLPKNVILEDETSFELSDDEFICILSWIKYFNFHYEKFGDKKYPDVIFPVISKRLHLDFGLYRVPCENEKNRGKQIIYLSQNGKLLDGSIKKKISVRELLNTWLL